MGNFSVKLQWNSSGPSCSSQSVLLGLRGDSKFPIASVQKHDEFSVTLSYSCMLKTSYAFFLLQAFFSRGRDRLCYSLILVPLVEWCYLIQNSTWNKTDGFYHKILLWNRWISPVLFIVELGDNASKESSPALLLPSSLYFSNILNTNSWAEVLERSLMPHLPSARPQFGEGESSCRLWQITSPADMPPQRGLSCALWSFPKGYMCFPVSISIKTS